MGYKYFIQRPEVWRYLQWDGSNLDEVVQYAEDNWGVGSTFVENQDGTWSFVYADDTVDYRKFNVGDWLNAGMYPQTDAQVKARWQEVSDTSVLYEVTGS